VHKIRCAVVGLGYWGPNLVRNVAALPSTTLATICDTDRTRLESLATQYKQARPTVDFSDIVRDSTIDAALIATPVSSHFGLAMQALEAGKHVFVEKPMAATVSEAEQLVQEAARRRRVLMVNHVFAYTAAVRKVRRLIDEGALGELYYYDSVRVNLGLFQHDVNVIWDLAVHDLSIMDYLVSERPQAVSAVASAHVPGKPENIAYVTCFFGSGLIGHLHVNWLAPVKIRQTLIGGSRKMVVYDDIEPDEKIKVYDRGLNNCELSPMVQVDYRIGDMWAPVLERTEALSACISHFAECIHSGVAPLTDGCCGLRVVRLLDAASRSAAQMGQPVLLEG
jgi:predicted dehydrogenase